MITSRRSVRGYLPTPIEQADLEEIFRVASRAPSGSNIQPWKVYVVRGAKKDQLSQKIIHVATNPSLNSLHRAEYQYYPKNWVDPFLIRRRKVGYDLYSLLGIARGEHEKMNIQHAKNYYFFGAPVGIFFTIPRILEQGSWLDYGMFIQNVMLAAKARGISTCAQAAFLSYHQIVSEHLGIEAEEQLVCAMSMGYEDIAVIENQLQTERADITEFVKFY